MKNIVISGGTRGIGKAIALKFAQEGFAVAICGRNQTSLNELQNEIEKISTTGKNLFIACDVTDTNSLKLFAQKVLNEWTEIDILVNNAGVFLPGNILTEEDGLLEKLMKTNLYSAYHLTRAFAPTMIQKKAGQIFNMCSVASQIAYPNGGSYSISKFALLGFSKSLREELKPHQIKVTTLLPGATLTDSWNGVDLPDSRFMKPEDIADILFSIYNLSPNTVIEEVLLRPVLGDI